MARVPLRARALYRAVEVAATEAERRRLGAEATGILCEHVRRAQHCRLLQHLRSGRTFSRGVALCSLVAFRAASGKAADDEMRSNVAVARGRLAHKSKSSLVARLEKIRGRRVSVDA